MPFDWALPSSWQWATIEQIQAPIARPIVTGPFGSSIGSRFFVSEGVPVIRGNNLSVERIRFIDDGFVYLTEEKAAEFKNLEAHPGDLVFTAAGTIGQVGIIPEKPRFQRYIISNKQMRARLDTALIEPLFAYYWFTEPYMREHIISRNTGSTIPLINLSVLRSLPVPLPPLETQREIVQVLGDLDDKIALLRETNATLEAIAQSLFKSWFVDFDPVRAKAEGRDPVGVPPKVADLFPSEFEDSELGEIPKGWRVGKLGDISCNLRVGAKPEELTDDTAYIGLEHMPRQSIALEDWESASKVESGKSRFRKGQILFGKLRPYFHKVGIAPLDGVCSTDILVIEPSSPAWHAVCVCHYSSKVLVEHATQLSNGAKMPRTNWSDLANYRIVVPPDEVAQAFEDIVSPLLSRIPENVHGAKTLAETRDALLPRLMSGKPCIPQAGALQ